MQNYFNYFTEIEQRFQQRRGTLLLLSTLDWALIESWRVAGIPLAAVLRGIDAAFDRHEARRAAHPNRRLARVNGLAWAAQAVMEAAAAQVDATTGIAPEPTRPAAETGFEPAPVAAFLEANATRFAAASASAPDPHLADLASRLHALATEVRAGQHPNLEALDRILTLLEERLAAHLSLTAPEPEVLALRAQSARELAPYRARMQPAQLRQVEQQFLFKRLLEARNLPRLSLFYMPHS